MNVSWQPPVRLTVHAFDLSDREWSLVYQGPSDVDPDTSQSVVVQSVLADAPGLSTWAWWYETDSEGHGGPEHFAPPVTTEGKDPPHISGGAMEGVQ